MADELTLISGPADISYSRNPIEIELETKESGSYVILKVCDASSNEITSLYGKADSDDRVKFDVSEILDTKVFYEVPSLSVLNKRCYDPIIKYWCEAKEYDEDSSLVDSLDIGKTGGDSVTLYVLKGGLSQEKLSISIFTKINSDKLFLSWADQIYLKSDQPYCLYYIHLNSTESIVAKAKVYYSDGTNDTKTLASFTTALLYSVYYISVGFDQNELYNLQSSKTPVYYEVWIENTTPLTRAGKLTFNLSDDYSLYPKHFFYANSLGGYEGLFATGKNQIIPKGDNSEVLQNNSSGGLALQFAHQIEKQGKIAPGFKSKAEIERLNDILLTSETYEIINDSLIKIVIDKKSKLNYVLDENLSPFVINYKRAFLNKNFTPDNVSS